MTMTLSMFHALWTGLLLAVFIGIVVWAYSGKRRKRFDAAARLPLDDGDD
jgi:cytochrome c oxidase cbb3-type subunit 4